MKKLVKQDKSATEPRTDLFVSNSTHVEGHECAVTGVEEVTSVLI